MLVLLFKWWDLIKFDDVIIVCGLKLIKLFIEIFKFFVFFFDVVILLIFIFICFWFLGILWLFLYIWIFVLCR